MRFGPGHPEWDIPSKRAKWAKGVVGFVDDKNLLVYTVVSGAYVWYIPLFLHCAMKVKNCKVKVVVYGDIPNSLVSLIDDDFGDKDRCVVDVRPYPISKNTPYHTASLRYLVDPMPHDERYLWTLITDIDMLMMPEPISIVEQHAVSGLRHGTWPVYDNYISHDEEGRERVPGVHFVGDSWWGATLTARERELSELENYDLLGYDHDERMLYRLIKDSGVPMPAKDQNIWAHHGVHLGDYRALLKRKEWKGFMSGLHSSFVKSLLKDDRVSQYVDIADRNAPELQTGLIFEKWKGDFR